MRMKLAETKITKNCSISSRFHSNESKSRQNGLSIFFHFFLACPRLLVRSSSFFPHSHQPASTMMMRTLHHDDGGIPTSRACNINDSGNFPAEALTRVSIPLEKDATLFSDRGEVAGVNNDLLVGTLDGTMEYSRVLLQFAIQDAIDDGTIPSTAVVDCAEVGLHLILDQGMPEIEMFRVSQKWGQRPFNEDAPVSISPSDVANNPLGATRPVVLQEATWTHAEHPSQVWIKEGGAIDQSNPLSAEFLHNSAYWYGGNELTKDLVQGWISGSFPNYGVALVQRQEGSEAKHNLYVGSDRRPWGENTYAPQLVLTYAVPTAPPNVLPVASQPTSAPLSRSDTTEDTSELSRNDSNYNNSRASSATIAFAIIVPVVVVVIAIVSAFSIKRRRKNVSRAKDDAVRAEEELNDSGGGGDVENDKA
mmetsp:Transcript_2778/g.7754  ORF Transcript_2778/g.7754 Transcript_2778/m.7754 type:complete len:421 (-) Transcript_2778:178-1440(-)